MKLMDRDLTHAINVKGVWWGCKYAIQSMKKHGKGGSIINTASMVAKVGSAAPQIACMLTFLNHVHSRYGIERGGSGLVKGTRHCACKRWHSYQFTLSRAIEHAALAKFLGYSGEETSSDNSFANWPIWFHVCTCHVANFQARQLNRRTQPSSWQVMRVAM